MIVIARLAKFSFSIHKVLCLCNYKILAGLDKYIL